MARTKKVTRASEEIVKKIRETDTAIEEAKENVKSRKDRVGCCRIYPCR